MPTPLSILLAIAATASAKYNVIHIVIDDLRPELGCYGLPNRSTPTIDKFAAGGTVFDSAYCNIGVCGPSRNSNPPALTYAGHMLVVPAPPTRTTILLPAWSI